jgi:hypothetical protein
MKSKIENSITQELINPTIDLIADYSQCTLDTFLDNEAIKQLPIVKTVVGFIKGGLKIKEIFFVKKLLVFLQRFHSAKTDENELLEFKKRFKTDLNYRVKVVEQILIMNERFISIEKSKIYANLFFAHTSGLLDWEHFITLSAILDNLNIDALKALSNLEFPETHKRYFDAKPVFNSSLCLLINSGLVMWLTKSGNYVLVTHYGVCMHQYGVKGNFELNFDELYELTPFDHEKFSMTIGLWKTEKLS